MKIILSLILILVTETYATEVFISDAKVIKETMSLGKYIERNFESTLVCTKAFEKANKRDSLELLKKEETIYIPSSEYCFPREERKKVIVNNYIEKKSIPIISKIGLNFGFHNIDSEEKEDKSQGKLRSELFYQVAGSFLFEKKHLMSLSYKRIKFQTAQNKSFNSNDFDLLDFGYSFLNTKSNGSVLYSFNLSQKLFPRATSSTEIEVEKVLIPAFSLGIDREFFSFKNMRYQAAFSLYMGRNSTPFNIDSGIGLNLGLTYQLSNDYFLGTFFKADNQKTEFTNQNQSELYFNLGVKF